MVLHTPIDQKNSIENGGKNRVATSQRRSKTQRGSAMLEGTIVILPLLALGFAILDFSLAIFIQNTLRNAVREGVRFAITQQTGTGGQDSAIVNAVKSNSMGFLNSSSLSGNPPEATITIQYYNPLTLGAATGVGSNAGGNICVVTATIKHRWMAPVWRATGILTFSASSSDLMEAPAAGILPSR